MPYATSALNHNNSYTLQCTAASGNAVVTVMTIKTTGAVTCEALVSPNGARSIGNGIARIVFIASAPPAVQGVFTITQSGNMIADFVLNGSAPADLIVQCTVT
jgi:hypothetical protein